MNTDRLTEGRIGPALLRFALPFLAASFLQQLYGTVDTLAVGRLSAEAAAELSAVSTGAEVTFSFTTLVTGVATGGTVLIGQYAGARQTENLRRTIGAMFPLFGIIGLLITAVLAGGAGAIVSLMQVPPAAVGSATRYLVICGAGMLFVTGYNMIAAIMRGLGDSKTPMLLVAIACVINIAGDIVLVGPLRMGAAGAAVATIAAQACAFLFSLFLLRRRRDFPLEFSRRGFVLRCPQTGLLLRLGVPVAAQDFLIGVSFLLISAFVNRLGLDESAAVGVVSRISTIAMLVSTAFMSAIAAMTAQNVGSGRMDRAVSALRLGLLWSFLFSFAAFLVIQLWPVPLISLFTEDAGVIAKAALYMRTYSIDIALVPFVFCLNGFFSGCGHTVFSMVNNLIATFAVRVGGTLLITLLPGTTMLHIGLAAPAASAVQIVIQLVYYRLGTWRSNTVLHDRT